MPAVPPTCGRRNGAALEPAGCSRLQAGATNPWNPTPLRGTAQGPPRYVQKNRDAILESQYLYGELT
jgi:hypothetical protein